MKFVSAPLDVVAEPFARLPAEFHHRGEPNEWVRTTRPGQRLHSFFDGCVFDAEGNLWLADVPYGRLFRIDPAGRWSLAHHYDGEPHGLALLPRGNFVIADYRFGLLDFDPKAGAISVVCERVNSERFRGLSDVKRAPNGDLWFTDPGRSSLSDPTGRVFHLRTGQTHPEMVLANVPYPNGIALNADGSSVYVAATRSNAVWRLLAEAPDPVFPMAGIFLQLSGGLGPDGIAIDRAGHIAVAQAQAGRAYVFSPVGDCVACIRAPEGTWTTNVCFSPDDRWLYLVEAQCGAISRIDMSSLSTPGPKT